MVTAASESYVVTAPSELYVVTVPETRGAEGAAVWGKQCTLQAVLLQARCRPHSSAKTLPSPMRGRREYVAEYRRSSTCLYRREQHVPVSMGAARACIEQYPQFRRSL